MSRTYDAKTHTLRAYPEYCEEAIWLFLGYVDMGEAEFEYEHDQPVREYLYGKDES